MYSKIVRNLHVFIYILDHRKVPYVHVLRLYRPALDECICDHAYVYMYVHVCVYLYAIFTHMCATYLCVHVLIWVCAHTYVCTSDFGGQKPMSGVKVSNNLLVTWCWVSH